MGLTLNNIPGFADLPATQLAAETPALGSKLAKISSNAAFGMVRTEVFFDYYHDGETVALPQSPIDKYNYQRDELTYFWTLYSTFNKSTGWVSGQEALWYGAWLVDQTTGLVSIAEAYRYRGRESKANPTRCSDGTLGVYVIAQRQRSNLVIASEPIYSTIDDVSIVTDVPLGQTLAQTLGENSKFAAVSSEVIYMGEYVDGDVVPQPQSPADGYTYAYSDVKFAFSWRWTVRAATFVEPNLGLGILNRMRASIDGSGNVTCVVDYEYYGVNEPPSAGADSVSTHGRIAVFAFCTRPNGPAASSVPNDDFVEISPVTFASGQSLRASTVRQINDNTREAALTPEFFGPTTYAHGDTVPLPTSAVDGYTYSRSELRYVWTLEDTGTEDHRLVGLQQVFIDSTTGLVTITVRRLPNGSNTRVTQHGMTIKVITVAERQRVSVSQSSTGATPPDDDGGDQGGNDTESTLVAALNSVQVGTQASDGNSIFLKIDTSAMVKNIFSLLTFALEAQSATYPATGHLVVTKAVLRRAFRASGPGGVGSWADSVEITDLETDTLNAGFFNGSYAVEIASNSADLPVQLDRQDIWIIIYVASTGTNGLWPVYNAPSTAVRGGFLAGDQTATTDPSTLEAALGSSVYGIYKVEGS